MDNCAVLQLDAHRFIVQLHQKPTRYTQSTYVLKNERKNKEKEAGSWYAMAAID